MKKLIASSRSSEWGVTCTEPQPGLPPGKPCRLKFSELEEVIPYMCVALLKVTHMYKVLLCPIKKGVICVHQKKGKTGNKQWDHTVVCSPSPSPNRKKLHWDVGIKWQNEVASKVHSDVTLCNCRHRYLTGNGARWSKIKGEQCTNP